MPPFLHESLLWWGLPLVGVPILIHLINMMRHRRVRWAAMEFLLVSQKRHRTWIILKQLLLLLLRMAAVAAVVLMLAQPLLRKQLGGVFSGGKTTHIVLLDDSFSMSDRADRTSAFDQAKQVVARLAEQASHQDTTQTFSLIRFSRVAEPDWLQEPLTTDFSSRLEARLASIRPSDSAAGPEAALESINRLPARGEDETRVVYVVSDFRTREWESPIALRKSLDHLDESGAKIYLVNCVEAARPDLAIASLRPGAGTRAAGVPLTMEVGVTNFSPAVARDVLVRLEEDGAARPAVKIEQIAPGKTVTRRFPVLFTTAGQHELVARLEPDAVLADNARYCVIDVPTAINVLLIDGDSQAQDGHLLATALSPGGKTTSGIKPVVESPRFLRDHALEGYQAIYLLNIPRLDAPEIEAVERYVRGGGGVAFFLGELCRPEFFNESLYREGKGLFPAPLGQPTQLIADRSDKTPDLEVSDHAIFAIFAGARHGFLDSVIVERYFATAKGWSPASDSSTGVIARLRNKAPLAIEHKFGDGRVVAFLTKVSPAQTPRGSWNNWGRDNPSFVVAMQELQAYLSASRNVDDTRLVGAPLEVRFPAAAYQPDVRFHTPGGKADGALTVKADAVPDGLRAELVSTERSGFYEVQLTTRDGAAETRRWALNVEAAEGELKHIDQRQLADRLRGLNYQYRHAGDLDIDSQQLAGFNNLGMMLLYVAIAVLLGEQLLAYSASYHPSARGGAR